MYLQRDCSVGRLDYCHPMLLLHDEDTVMTRSYITLLLYRRSLVELYIAFRHSIELTPVIDMHSYLSLIIYSICHHK